MVDNTTNKIGEKNPYRYRSYYYDTETTWYYLNSRYYDSFIGRFITMDEIEYLGATSTILSYNLFTYCEGNPVNSIDPNGQFTLILMTRFVFILLVTVLIPTVIAAVSSYIPKKDEDEMDRQDITNDKKPLPTLPTESNPKTDPPKMQRRSGIDETDDFKKKCMEEAAEDLKSKSQLGGPKISSNYNVNCRGSLGGELEYIFNRDKYELWD